MLTADTADVNVLAAFPWWPKPADLTIYARTTVFDGGHKRWVYLHHLVNGYPIGGLETDHLDRNGLNNRRSNLRVATVPQNRQNTVRRKGSPFGRGVTKHGLKYVARLGNVTIGSFATVNAARVAYDAEAVRRYGPKARTGHRNPVTLKGLIPVKLDKPAPSPRVAEMGGRRA